MAGLWILLAAVAVALAGAVTFWTRSSRLMGTPRQHVTYETLHTASVAVSALRGGLTAGAAGSAAPALRRLLGTPAVALADRKGLLAYEGSERHRDALAKCLQEVVDSGRTKSIAAGDLRCGHSDECPVHAGVAVPIAVAASITRRTRSMVS